MTGYHISIGYNSHMNAAEHVAAFKTLKEVVEGLRYRPGMIADEAQRERDDSKAREYAEQYVPNDDGTDKDATIKIIEPQRGERGQIMQLASGHDETKKLVRRAFSRLVILAMHKRGIEVSLVVT